MQLTNAGGQSRRYAYNSRGALTRFIGADGRDLQFQYNERGEMQSVINAQNAGLLYQRNQRGSLKIQQGASQKSLWQIQTVSYGGAFTNSKIQGSCAFDDGFGFGEGGYTDFWGVFLDQFFTDSGFCNPFGSGGFGGGGFGGGETCYQCHVRERTNCQSALDTQLVQNGSVAVIAGAACLALPPPASAFCVVAVAATLAVANAQAYAARDNCYANVASRCTASC